MTDSKKPYFIFALGIFLISLAYYATTAGNHQIATRGEGREAIVAQSMFESKNFVLPLRNGSEIPSKPPLFHWIASAVASLDGELDEFDIRAPSVISSAIALSVGFLFYVKILGSSLSLALFTLLIFASTFEAMRGGSHGRVDGLFTATIALSCFSLFLLVDRSRSKTKINTTALVLIATASLILAGLAKGPAGILIPGFISTVFVATSYWQKREPKELLSSLLLLACCAVASVLGLSVWYYLAYLQHGDQFLQVQLYDENLARLFHLKTSGAYSESLGHKKPFYFSPIFLIVGFLPWSLFLPTYFALLYKRVREGKLFEDRYYLFALIWVCTFLLAVTASSSKRSVYFLPCYPALAYLLAFELTTNLEKFKQNSFYLLYLAKIVKGLSLVLGSLLLTALPFFLSKDLYSLLMSRLTKTNPYILSTLGVWHWTVTIALLLIVLAITILYRSSKALSKLELKNGIALFGTSMLAINLIVSLTIIPMLSELYSPKRFIEQISETIRNQPLYQYQDNFYAAMFYADRPIQVLSKITELAEKSGYILVSKKQLEEVTTAGDFMVLDSSSNLAANQKATLMLIKLKDSQP